MIERTTGGMATLECLHCGGVAVTAVRRAPDDPESGYFYEDMADRCATCGMPGHVYIDDDIASWTEDSGLCVDPDCEACYGSAE